MRKEDYRLWCYIWCILSITFIFVLWVFASAFDDLKEKGICPQDHTLEKIESSRSPCYWESFGKTYFEDGTSALDMEISSKVYPNGTRIPRCSEAKG